MTTEGESMTTPKPIDQLSPEELRVEIAEAMGHPSRVMKWEYQYHSGANGLLWSRGHPSKEAAKQDAATHLREVPRIEGYEVGYATPNYPPDANAALTLAHALAEKGWKHCHYLTEYSGIRFIFSRGAIRTGDFEKHESSSTGPHAFALALCRAYLAVVRAGKEQQG